jgi:hypothetical protein
VTTNRIAVGRSNNCKDVRGLRSGKLIALEPTAERKHNCVLWLCRCDCGNEVKIGTTRLISGRAQSCGCMEWQRRSAGQKRAWADPKVKRRHSVSGKKALANPDVRAKISARAYLAWKDPKVRECRTAGIKKAHARPETRAKVIAFSHARWNDPKFRSSHGRGVRKFWANAKPEDLESNREHLRKGRASQKADREELKRYRAIPKGGRSPEEKRAERVDALYKQHLRWDAIQNKIEAEFQVHTSVKALQNLRDRWIKRRLAAMK